MKGPSGRTVTGRYTPDGDERVSPEVGFGRAISDAVDQIANEWGPDDAPYEVAFALEARVDVWNPGQIGEYRAVASD